MRSHLTAATLLVGLAALAFPPSQAHADVLSRLVREAADAGAGIGGKASRRLVDGAITYASRLPPARAGRALVATRSTEGHWTFANAAGERMTVADATEMGRAVKTLLPGNAIAEPIIVLVPDVTLHQHRQFFGELPSGAELRLYRDGASHPIRRAVVGGAETHIVEFRPGVRIVVGEQKLFEEAIFQLSRPLARAKVRVLALETGGPVGLQRTPPAVTSGTGLPIEPVEPFQLAMAFRAIGGQTAVLSGRIDGERLLFRSGGADRALPIADIRRAAEAHDVNLILLDGATRQPGARNWLWQRVEVDGLKDAVARSSLADFLAALAGDRTNLVVRVADRGSGRVALSAQTEARAAALPGQSGVGDIVADVVSEVTGNVATAAIEADLLAQEAQRERDLRLIPGIPAFWQIGYLAAFVAGLMGLPVLRGWWARLWPPEAREDYTSLAGYSAARLARFCAFLLLFMPIAGGPAALLNMALQVWAIVTLPWRLVGWIASRISPSAAR